MEHEKGRAVLEFPDQVQKWSWPLPLSRHSGEKDPAVEPASEMSRGGALSCVHVRLW